MGDGDFEKLKIKHKRSEDIMKMKDIPKHRLYCRNKDCNNIIMASEKPLQAIFKVIALNTPCSSCQNPNEYLKDLMEKQNGNG